jgi:hypothetical protein
VVLENSPARIKLALAEPTPYLIEEIRNIVRSGKSVDFCMANPHEVVSCLSLLDDPFSLTGNR